MVDPTPERPAVPDYDDAMAAAEELTRKREAESPIVTRDYIRLDGDRAGEPAPDNETIDIKRAVKDLTESANASTRRPRPRAIRRRRKSEKEPPKTGPVVEIGFCWYVSGKKVCLKYESVER